MASTTTAKKEIIDFLWEWAELKGDWAKLLIDKIVNTETSLAVQDRNEVFNYFIDSLRTVKKLPSITTAKPTFNATNKTVELSSLSNITGVNRLAKNQKIDFAKNFTVIYGENGTGKTGYGRVLKSLGFSYDPKRNIHHNIFGTNDRKAAQIDFTLNGIPKTLNWDGTNTDDALSNVSVFNNNCVQLSLSDRKLIVSPIGFHLFNLVTSELSELTALLNQKKATYTATLLCEAALNEGTPQQIFVKSLNEKSTEEQLKKVIEFTGDIDIAIEKKQKELQGLNQELIKTQIEGLNNQITELNGTITKIKTAESNLTQSSWDRLLTLNQAIAELESKSKLGLKDLADVNSIDFYESPEFKAFLISAEKYINLLEQPYPERGDTCVYCKQPLDESAKGLIKSYKSLLNDTTETDLKNHAKIRAELIQNISSLDDTFLLSHPSFGSDDHLKPIQPPQLTAFNSTLKNFKERFVRNTVVEGQLFDVKYQDILNLFQDKVEAINVILTEKREGLATISEQVVALQKALNELKDQKLLKENEAEIKKVIINKRSLSLLNSKANEFATNSISRKTSEARAELISQNFGDTFQNELRAFRKSHLKIDLSFGTDRGNSKITQKINQYVLTDILSEGEQKAIALAEFLTELDLDNTKAPVVFDDPVNSLDHTIIEEVAIRLIKLSKTRQVIIFTHSILLLNSLIQQSELDTNKQEGLKFNFYSVKNNFGETGILDEVEEINSHAYYIKKLNKVLECVDKTMSEEKLAAEGYGHLRSAIEICVEEDILKRTVKRYRKGVAFPALLRIEGAKIDLLKGDLNHLYEKCCTSIDGHSSPTELHVAPTIESLKVDFETYKKIKSSFKSN